MKDWVKVPTGWIREENLLADLRWVGAHKSDNTAALMLYTVIAHHANSEPARGFEKTGYAALSYSELGDLTALSKAKISGGLGVLRDLKLIEGSEVTKKGVFKIIGHEASNGWGKLPAKKMYNDRYSVVPIFHAFTSRNRHELNSLKLFFLIVAFRDNVTNYAHISYEKIESYAGIRRNDIRAAISLLAANQLVVVDHQPSNTSGLTLANIYRLAGVHTRRHMGTTGRAFRG